MIWALWAGACLAAFAVIELMMILTGRATLSMTIWRLTKAYPILPAIFGVVVGALAAHFWWPL